MNFREFVITTVLWLIGFVLVGQMFATLVAGQILPFLLVSAASYWWYVKVMKTEGKENLK